MADPAVALLCDRVLPRRMGLGARCPWTRCERTSEGRWRSTACAAFWCHAIRDAARAFYLASWSSIDSPETRAFDAVQLAIDESYSLTPPSCCRISRAQRIDRLQRGRSLDVPEGPAVAGFEPLHRRADAVDRADMLAAVRSRRAASRRRAPSPRSGGARRSARRRRASSPASSSVPNGMRGSARFPSTTLSTAPLAAADGVDAPARGRDVAAVALDADEVPAELLRDRARRAGAEEGIEHDVARLRRREQHAIEQRLRLLRRMHLRARRRPSAAPRRCRSAAPSRSASAGRR